MTRSRIILETSERKKQAMIAIADLQGETLAEWIDEQVTTILPSLSASSAEPSVDLQDVSRLNDSKKILKSLEGQDWAFTHADTRYLTHDIHPYPAKYIPQIPAHIISRLSIAGDLVLDPFGGSATTAVEAVRMGRRAISVDANPISELIGRVKTGFISPAVKIDLHQLLASAEGHYNAIYDAETSDAQKLINQYQKYIPDIPNAEKWFHQQAVGELALIKHLIENTTCGLARDAALVALSRIIIRISNQDTETRYVSKPKELKPAFTMRAFIESLKTVMRRMETSSTNLQYADAKFLVGDSREALENELHENSIDLIVSSPPYPNATDYHLYHRFRLFWLGFDPRALGRIEIGSHLRHQRNNTGFEEYHSDMVHVLRGCFKVLQPGRYAVFVVGDALFKGEIFSTSDAMIEIGKKAGFNIIGIIDRPVHKTKRSFAKPGRRARAEQLVVLQKPNIPVNVIITPPAYKMWDYEAKLRLAEIEVLTGKVIKDNQRTKALTLKINQPALWNIRRLTFSKDFQIGLTSTHKQPTWQKIIENGDSDPKKRKDPKYVTHGLHAYKGKFYPQLAKSLINISNIPVGARVFDPFCGSGTTLLEGMLNGKASYGCDFNPLAAKIAEAKTGILNVRRDIVDASIQALLGKLERTTQPNTDSMEQFSKDTEMELHNWFSDPILFKINWLLAQVRLFGDPILVSYYEVIISGIIRNVSHQEPADLRIRRRKTPLQDAPVLELFKKRLEEQQYRLKKYWSVAGRQPGRLIKPKIICGDSRTKATLNELGILKDSVDCIVTSPPYAMSLPYIDTDRLSLLAIMGITAKQRSSLEENLTGSREIKKAQKKVVENAFLDCNASGVLPHSVVASIRNIYTKNSNGEVGFRRANMPSLLWRFFIDMKQNLEQMKRIMKPGSKAYYVVGNSKTQAGSDWTVIDTCSHIMEVAKFVGLTHVETIPIDVTTENYKHIKNAITKNQIIVLQKN